MSWFKVLMFGLFSVMHSAPLPYKSCGDGTLVIQDLNVEPFPLQKSVDSTLSVHGMLKDKISAGQYSITVSVDGLQLYSKSGDLCALDQSICPQSAGEKTVVKNFSIPSLAPSGSYTADIKINNNDQLIACYMLSFDLS
jgi:hypothetical protein